jgi:hypothetical protein
MSDGESPVKAMTLTRRGRTQRGADHSGVVPRLECQMSVLAEFDSVGGAFLAGRGRARARVACARSGDCTMEKVELMLSSRSERRWFWDLGCRRLVI